MAENGGDIDGQLERKLKRLRTEYDARKALKTDLDRAHAERAAASRTLDEHKAILEQLPQNLKAVSAAAQAVQGLLGIDALDRVQRHEQARSLAAPLFTAYCQLEAYNDVHGPAVLLSVESGAVVCVVLSADGSDRLKFVLRFMAETNCVVVDAPAGSLDGLFEGDNGSGVAGVPFKFAQALAGIYVLDAADQTYLPPTARDVVDRIRRRLADRKRSDVNS